MARVFMDGAELADLLFWDSIAGSGTFTVATDFKRSGAYSYKTTGQTATKNITALAEGYFRMGFRLNAQAGTNPILLGRKGGNTIWQLKWNRTSQRLELYVNATLIGTGTTAIQNDTWYLLEVYFKVADSDGRLALKVEGNAMEIDYTGDTKPGTDTNIDNLFLNQPSGGSSAYWIDDLALNDTTGGVDDSWCGDGHIIYIAPDADGDVSQLTGSDGNSVANWDNVNAVPYNAAIYNQSNTPDQYDLYNLADYDGTGRLITRVWVEGRAIDTVAAGGKCALGLKPATGSESWSSDLSLLTSYARYVGPEYKTNPLDSGVWEESDINALQVGFKVRS